MVDDWKLALERDASVLREYMRSSSDLPHWQRSDELAPAEEDPRPAGPSAERVEVLAPIGLPVSPESERLLQRVAYAPRVEPDSPWAREVRVRQEDFRRCLSWNTHLAEHEALPLCHEKGTAKPGKTHADLVHEACNKQPQDKVLFTRLREHLRTAVAPMKCLMAIHASQEAASSAITSVTSHLEHMQSSLSRLMADGVEGGYIRPELLDCEEYKDVLSHMDEATAASKVLESASSYAAHTALCGTDAAARGVRSVVQHHRVETLRVTTGHKEVTESPAAGTGAACSALFTFRRALANHAQHAGPPKRAPSTIPGACHLLRCWLW